MELKYGKFHLLGLIDNEGKHSVGRKMILMSNYKKTPDNSLDKAGFDDSVSGSMVGPVQT